MDLKIKIIFILFIFIFYFYSCSQVYLYNRNSSFENQKYYNFNDLPQKEKDLRNNVISNAIKAKELKEFRIGSKKYNYDCSGFIFYVYEISNIYLSNYFNYSIVQNGVYLLYDIGKTYFKLDQNIGFPGDIIIFDNTYDRNKNNKWDDEFTHAAIIIDYDQKNKIYKFAHIGSGVWKIDFMSLEKKDFYKNGVLIFNSYLRRNNNSESSNKYLASNLFKIFVNILSYYK